MSMNIARKPAMPQRMEASDKPLIRKEEQERADKSLKHSQLTEDERLAVIAKYGAPTRPMHKVFAIPQRNKEAGNARAT